MMSLESVKKDMTSTPTLSGEGVLPSVNQFICRAPARAVGAIEPKDKSVGPASLRGRQAKRRIVGNASNFTRICIYTTRIRSAKVGSDEVNHVLGAGLPRA